MIGPEEPIPYPNYTEQLDCELEIGVVVGREGRNLRGGTRRWRTPSLEHGKRTPCNRSTWRLAPAPAR